MVLTKTILILEDNLNVLSVLLEKLFELENDIEYDLSVIVLTDSKQVKDYINDNPNATFDIALVDRDCKLNRSFHILDLERFKNAKFISISSIPEYNHDLKKRGVESCVQKDLMDVEGFSEKVVSIVREKLIPTHLNSIMNDMH